MNKCLFQMILSLLLAVCLDAKSEDISADSVINPGLRGRTKAGGPVSKNEAMNLLHSVPLGSQVNENVFVDYGPYMNTTESVMRVSIVSRGMSGRRTLVASVDGTSYQEGVDVLTMIIPPKTKFNFRIKDFAEITASIDSGGYKRDQVGLPSESEFIAPHGEYLRCVNQVFRIGREYVVSSSINYLYRAGSLSDKSIRKDRFNERDPGVTSGVRPPNPGVCEGEEIGPAAEG